MIVVVVVVVVVVVAWLNRARNTLRSSLAFDASTIYFFKPSAQSCH
jgi:hypothetical protein